MPIQNEIENINDIICNIKVLMEEYFYTQNYINTNFAKVNHTHPIDTQTDVTSLNPLTNKAITNALAGKADNVLVSNEANGLMAKEDYTKLSNIEDGATYNQIDDALSSSSTNAVQNKVIKNKLDSKADNVTANNNRNGLLTKGDYKKLSEIETKATRNVIDDELSDSSTNAVENRAIVTALNSKADKNVVATTNTNGLMTTDYVNAITNLQESVVELQGKIDKNDIRILFLRYHNGNFDGADGTQLVVSRGQDYVYAQIDCDDSSYDKSNRVIRLYINGVSYNRTTDKNGRTTSGKLIELDPGVYFISAFLDGDEDKNMVVDHKLLVVS